MSSIEARAAEPGEDLAAWRPDSGAMAHGVVTATLAGGIAGMISGGIGGRLAMRVTALMATDREQGTLTEAEEIVGEITLDGTRGLILFAGLLTGILGGMMYAVLARWVADAGGWRGLVFGIGLLVAFGWTVIEGDNFDFSTFGSVWVNVLMFAAIFVLFGVLVAPLHAWVGRALPAPSMRWQGLAVLPLYAIALFLALGTFALTAIAFGEDGLEAPLYAVMPLWVLGAGLAVGAVASRRGRGFERLSDLRGDPAALRAALLVVAVPLIAGIVLDAQSLAEMLGKAY